MIRDEQYTPRLRRFAFLLILLAALTLRLCRLDFQDIWWDEARNIDVASRPLTQIASAPELDIHPPLYFYLLHGWLALFRVGGVPGGAGGTVEADRTAFVVRFMSLWFGVLLVSLMYALGRRAGGQWAGIGAALGAAFLPFLLGEAQETRMYTAGLVWVVGAVLALVEGRHKALPLLEGAAPCASARCSNTSGRSWFWFALFSALALLTHYATVFALVLFWGWAMVWAVIGDVKGASCSKGLRSKAPLRQSFDFAQDVAQGRLSWGWPRVRTVLLAGLLTTLLCLLDLPVALRQIPSYRNPNLTVPTVGAYLAELGRVYGLGEHIDFSTARPWQLLPQWAGTRLCPYIPTILLATFLLGGWVLALWQSAREVRVEGRPKEGRHKALPLLPLTWAILPLVVYYLVIRDRATFASRYIAFALPGWLLLGGLALRGWAQAHRALGALAAVGLVVALAPGIWGDLSDPRYFREDMRGLVAWLKANTTPNDLILVDQRYPFGFYYERWNNSRDGVPPSEPVHLAPAQYLFVDINTVADRLTTLAQGKHRVFWVRWFESDTDPRGAVPFLLEKFGALLGERGFRGYTVSWYAINLVSGPSLKDFAFELAPALTDLPTDFGGQVRLLAAAFGGRGPGLTSTVAETRLPVAPADKVIWAAVRWARLPGGEAHFAARPLKATLMLEDANGLIVGRDDRPILNDRHLAPQEWSEADQPLGVYLVQPEPATPPGTYTLKLAVYDPVTLAQLPAQCASPFLKDSRAGTRHCPYMAGQAVQGSFVTLGHVTLTRATAPPAPARLPIVVPATLDWRGVRLLGCGPLPDEISPGGRLAFDLYWQALRGGLPEMQVQLALIPAEPAAATAAALSRSRSTSLRMYPLGRESPIAGGYSTTQWLAGETVRDHQLWWLAPTLPNGVYHLQLRLITFPDRDMSPPVLLEQVTVSGRSHVFELPAQMGQRSGARFGDFARLLGFDYGLTKDPAAAVTLTLYWQPEEASPIPYTVSAQLLDGSGTLRAQRDREPGDGTFPTTSWVAGEVLADSYRIELPAGLPPGSYTLIVKMYDPVTAATLSVTVEGRHEALPLPGDMLRLATVEVR